MMEQLVPTDVELERLLNSCGGGQEGCVESAAPRGNLWWEVNNLETFSKRLRSDVNVTGGLRRRVVYQKTIMIHGDFFVRLATMKVRCGGATNDNNNFVRQPNRPKHEEANLRRTTPRGKPRRGQAPRRKTDEKGLAKEGTPHVKDKNVLAASYEKPLSGVSLSAEPGSPARRASAACVAVAGWDHPADRAGAVA